MSLNRRNPKRDANEAIIVEALEARGFHVDRVSARGFPDLVVSKRDNGQGWVWFVEVKRATGQLEALYTPAQRQWRQNWQGPIPRTLRTVDEAKRFPNA
jgi:hypothetical protein